MAHTKRGSRHLKKKTERKFKEFEFRDKRIERKSKKEV